MYHICMGGDAQLNVSDYLAECKRVEPIVTFPFDLNSGPLADISNDCPSSYMSWFLNIFINLINEELSEYELNSWRQSLSHEYSNFIDVINSKSPITVWIGKNAHDKLMLALIAYMSKKSRDILIMNVGFDSILSNSDAQCNCSYHRVNAVGMCHVADLFRLIPIKLDYHHLYGLSLFWKYWQQHGNGWRSLDRHGNINEQPFTRLDDIILTKLLNEERVELNRFVGDLMAELKKSGALLVDAIFLWRVNLLHHAGLLDLQYQHDDSSEATWVVAKL